MTTDTQSAARLDRRMLLAAGGTSALAALALAAGPAQAQPAAGPQTAAQAGTPTPSPQPPPQAGAGVTAGIAPESLAAMQEWMHSLALQAATYAAPIVAMYNLRATVAVGPNPKAPPGQIWRVADITTPAIAAEAGYVTPNVNVVYGFGFADLGQQPYILTAPDSGGRYYMIEIVDMWTHAFAYPAGKLAGYNGGKFALVGPGWHGELPAGVTRIDCPTRWIELQPRVHVRNEADLAAAQKVLAGITLQGLAEYHGGPAPAPAAYDYEVPRIDPNVASSQMQFDDPLQFWSIFVAAMNENPPPATELNAMLPQFRYLGIEFGKPWDRRAVSPLVLHHMADVAGRIGKMMNAILPLGGRTANGWVIPSPDMGDAGGNYLSRALVAVFGLTANTPAEALYYSGVVDGHDEPLSGARRYSITLKQPMRYLEPVAPGFWSMTMYDGVTRLTVPNAINRYSLGSDDALTRDADGSLTLYIQHASPGADKEANWLPAPAGPFYLILRTYAPNPESVAALNDLASFQGPPPLLPVGAT